MARRTDLETLGSVILRQKDVRSAAKAANVGPVSARDWEEAVGSRIAARARPFRLDGAVLWVQTASATWAQELSLLSETIVEALRARGVQVTSLRFRVGPVAPVERPPERTAPRRCPPLAPLPDKVGVVLAHVADDELRASIEKAARRNLGWQGQRRDDDPRAGGPTSARRAARGPRSAAPENVPRGRTSGRAPGGPRRKP